MANSTKFQLVPNTWEELRAALGMVLVFVAIILSWANINTQLALLNQKTDTIIATQDETKTAVQANTDKIAALQTDVTRLDTIVADAQARGILAAKQQPPSNSDLAFSNPGAPTPSPALGSSNAAGRSAQPQQVTVNNFPQPSPQPTQAPRPTPTPQSGNIIQTVAGLLGL